MGENDGPPMGPGGMAEDVELWNLLDDRDTMGPDAYATTADVDFLEVYREVSDPTVKGGIRLAFLFRLTEPSATIADLAAKAGGGVFVLRAMSKTRGLRLSLKREVAGEPLPVHQGAPGAGSPMFPPPVMETGSGMVGIPGLTPEMQWVFSMMQLREAQVRDDARAMVQMMAHMMGTISKIPQSNNNEMMLFLRTILTDTTGKLQASNAEVETLRNQKTELLLDRAARSAAGGGQEDAVRGALNAVLSHAPELVDLAVDAIRKAAKK
jgi:hypothetical protein